MLRIMIKVKKFKFPYFRTLLINKRSFSMNTNNTPREIKIDTPSGSIAAKVWNESGNKTPIMAFHGWMDNAGTFDNLCPLLDKDFPVYSFDFPGHGYSYHPPFGSGVYLSEYVVFIHRVLHYMRFNKVILLGHSLGAYTALFYAGTIPKVAEKIIMIDCIGPICYEAADQPEMAAKCLEGLIKAEERNSDTTPKYSYEEIIQRLIKGYEDNLNENGSINEEAAKLLLVRNSRRHEDGKYSFTLSPLISILKFGGTMSLTKDHGKFIISRVNCDLLLIKSPTSPLFVEKDVAKEYFRCHKNARKNFVVEIVEGTHYIHIMNSIPVAHAINNFLHCNAQSAESKAMAEKFISSL